MANQLYGYSSSGGYGGGSVYTSRSLADQYLSADSSSFLSSSRYFGSDTLSSSSAYSSITDRTLFNHTDPITGTASRITGSQQLWPGPPGVDIATSAASVDPLYAGLKRSASEAALYHQTLLGVHNTIGQSEAWFSTNPLVKRPRFENTSNLPIYPQRPGEKDCAHYMLTRTCKFGESCKFDHPIWVPEGGIPDWKEVPISATNEPLPERPGEPDCPYFLKTQRCKFGLRCKFNHPKDKENASLLALENADVSALPERPSEPHCAFYLKTGKCKFGPTCKFHHPRDILVPFATEENVNDMQNEANKNGTGGLATSLPIFTPALMHNSKGLPIRPGEADCPFYLKTGSCKYGATCRYNHPDRFAISVPGAIGPAIVATPAAHLNIGVLSPSASMLQPIDPRLAQTTLALAPNIYPQRPGQIECDFYMKTGVCKFVERCKFHHPIDRSTNALPGIEAQQINVKLTLAGLPRREGAINCPYYMKTGACKYGATCKFDHPPPGEVMATATSQGALVTSGGEENDSQREVETVQE